MAKFRKSRRQPGIPLKSTGPVGPSGPSGGGAVRGGAPRAGAGPSTAPGVNPAAVAARRRRRRQGGKDSLRADLSQAEKLAEDFGLIPEMGTVDAGRSDEVSDLISKSEDIYSDYETMSPEQRDFLDTMKAGLGGLTDEEKQAFREEAGMGLDSELQTALRSLGSENAARGVMGAAANAGALDLYGQRINASRGIERDIQLRNLDEKLARQQAYGGFLSQAEADQYARRTGALTSLSGLVGAARADELNRELFNLEQQDKATGVKQSVLFGLAGAKGSRRAQRRAFKLAQQQIAAENAAYGQARDASSRVAAQFGGAQSGTESTGGI